MNFEVPNSPAGSATFQCLTTRSATVQVAQGKPSDALASYQAGLAVREHLAKSAPGQCRLGVRSVGGPRLGAVTCRWRKTSSPTRSLPIKRSSPFLPLGLGGRTARLLCLRLIFDRCVAAIAEWFVPRCATSANGHTVADFVLITVR
jgi:hypothetical protein